jgi:hypothetical protein
MKANLNYNNEAHVLYSDGQNISNGKDLGDSSSFELKFKAKLRTRTGSIQPDGNVVKTKRSISILVPITDSTTGVTTVNVGRVELEIHPDMPDADVNLFRAAIADALSAVTATQFNRFWLSGNCDTDA